MWYCEGCKRNDVEDKEAQRMELSHKGSSVRLFYNLCPGCLEKHNKNQLNLEELQERFSDLVRKSIRNTFAVKEAF